MKHLTLVEGDVNLLSRNEILISKDENYTILRRRLDNDGIETYVVVPLKDFNNEASSRKEMEEI